MTSPSHFISVASRNVIHTFFILSQAHNKNQLNNIATPTNFERQTKQSNKIIKQNYL